MGNPFIESLQTVNNNAIEFDRNFNSKSLAQARCTHLLLKNDDEYKIAAINQAYNLINFFEKSYPGIVIDNPLLREKSSKSIFDKITSLEIERMGKLFLIESDIPDKLHRLEKNKLGYICPVNLNFLNSLISKRISENLTQDEAIEGHKALHNVLFDNVKDINISNIENSLLDKDKLSKNSKVAILRVLFARIKTSNLPNKNNIMTELDNKYGEVAAELSDNPENDLLGYENILSIENSSYNLNNHIFDNRYNSKLERLIHEQEFLRCKDLIGMQIIINTIPDNFTSSNPKINELLKQREQIKDKNAIEYKTIDQDCMTAISEDFIDKLTTSADWLKNNKVKVVRDSVKHKRKANGYLAEHIKFELMGDPKHTLECQIKSKYVEARSHGTGSAAHSARIGKERILPQILQDSSKDITKVSDSDLQQFKKELTFMLPKFVEFRKNENGQYEHYNFSTLENCFKFYDVVFNKDHTSALKLAYLLNKFKEVPNTLKTKPNLRDER